MFFYSNRNNLTTEHRTILYTVQSQYEYDTIHISTLAHAFRVRVSLPEVQPSVEAIRTVVQIAWPFWVRVFKCLAQASSSDNTGSCRESDPSIRNGRF